MNHFVLFLAGLAFTTPAWASVLFFSPTLESTLLQVSTVGHTTPLKPCFSGETGLTIGNINTLGIEAAATPDFLNSDHSPNNIYYSNLGVFYRYRVLGAPLRAPVFPLNPQYGANHFKRVPLADGAAYGTAFNMDIGARLFFSGLRSLENAAVDAELAHSYQGLALNVSVDRRISAFRLRLRLDGGYSFLRGSLLTGAISAGLTYEKWLQVSPGLTLHYVFVKGKAAGDNGTTPQISNQLMSFGLILYFKM